MSLGTFLLGQSPGIKAGPGNADDFWYKPVGFDNIYSGVDVDPEEAMRVSTVNACVRLISGVIAMFPVEAYKIGKKGTERRRRYRHPVEEILENPNPIQTGYEFRETMTIDLLLRGNAYALKVLGPVGGGIEQLWRLHPDAVRPVVKEGVLIYEVSRSGGRTVDYAPADIVHLRDITYDGINGLSRIEQIKQGIGLSLVTEKHGARHFGQGGRPSGVLTSDKPLKDAAYERLQKSWDAAYGGSDNSGKTAILEDGIHWEKVVVDNNDAQYLETRQFQVADIARAFGVPLHMIQSQEKSTAWGTGLEQMSRGFVTFTLGPSMCRWEAVIKRDLIIERDVYVEHNPDRLLLGALKDQMDGYKTGISAGIMSPDEARAKLGMNPRDDGEGGKYRHPANESVDGEEPEEEVVMAPPGSNGAGAPMVPGENDTDQGDSERDARRISR